MEFTDESREEDSRASVCTAIIHEPPDEMSEVAQVAIVSERPVKEKRVRFNL